MLRAVLGQVDWWWIGLYRPRVEGLTDEELWWSPVERCWTVHPEESGRVRIDAHWPPPQNPPFTTLVWRIAHIGLMLAGRTQRYFPDHAPEPWGTPPHADTVDLPTTADGLLDFVDRWWTAWRAGLEAAGEAPLWEPYGGVEGSFPEMQLAAEDPFLNLVLHTHRELMHHGAEIALLRDLFLAQQRRDPYVDAVLDGNLVELARLEREDPGIIERYRASRPDLPMGAAEISSPEPLRLLATRGFDLNALDNGHTALHHLVAHGDLALIENAIALGADPTVRDSTFGGDSIAWSEHFERGDAEQGVVGVRADIAAHLRALVDLASTHERRRG